MSILINEPQIIVKVGPRILEPVIVFSGDVGVEAAIRAAADVTLQQNINLKANINSPALTGTPTAPTAAPGTDTDQIATTAFVADAIIDEGEV